MNYISGNKYLELVAVNDYVWRNMVIIHIV